MNVNKMFACTAVILMAVCSSQVLAAKKTWQWEGMHLVMTSTGLIVDGKPATIIEKEPQAKVYQQGLFNYVVYSNGKIGVTDTSGVFKGYAK